MRETKFYKGSRALVVVAHPDDETIWMGGFILAHPEFDWTIFSLCRASDRDRAPKFRRVCKRYGARAVITDLEDEGRVSVERSVPAIKKLITEKIGDRKFDFIFTHGKDGEYGHPRHIGVNLAVNELTDKGKLKTDFILYFNYKKTSRQKFSPLEARVYTDLWLNMDDKEFAAKKRIMTDIYGFAPDGIDAGYCTNPEAFKTIHITRNTKHATRNIVN